MIAAIVFGVLVILVALWGIWRYLVALELHRLKESVTFVSPADAKVRTFPIYGGVYDAEERGDFDV